MADFGGAIGLWLGASMITVFEFLEYFLDIFILCCCKCCKRNKQRPKSHAVTVSPRDISGPKIIRMDYPNRPRQGIDEPDDNYRPMTNRSESSQSSTREGRFNPAFMRPLPQDHKPSYYAGYYHH